MGIAHVSGGEVVQQRLQCIPVELERFSAEEPSDDPTKFSGPNFDDMTLIEVITEGQHASEVA
ncbi:hypothetical protein [Streptomyces tauricus]|uniref:hypothetical protein n=1 Tax=Streptomyces tauricus TaxID=68274 RepID=UPI0038225592